MTNRQSLWDLLASQEGKWVPRENINFVGGNDAGRRMREIRADLMANPEYRLDERRRADGQYEYRLMKVPPEAQKVNAEAIWRCRKCSARLVGISMASIDPRWRLAKCQGCGDKHAIFERQHS